MIVNAHSVWENGKLSNKYLKKECKFFAGNLTKFRPNSDIDIVTVLIHGHGAYTMSVLKRYNGDHSFSFLHSGDIDSGVIIIGMGSYASYRYNGLVFFINENGRFFIKED